MTTHDAHLTALKFNLVARTTDYARWVNGRLRCTLDKTPSGWVIGAEGITVQGATWKRVLETINRLSE